MKTYYKFKLRIKIKIKITIIAIAELFLMMETKQLIERRCNEELILELLEAVDALITYEKILKFQYKTL